MDNAYELLRKALLWIDDLDVEDRNDRGICALVDDYCMEELEDVHDYLEAMFMDWPKFSGDLAFPIPGRAEAYFSRDRWSGEYGALREELLQFLIEQTNG